MATIFYQEKDLLDTSQSVITVQEWSGSDADWDDHIASAPQEEVIAKLQRLRDTKNVPMVKNLSFLKLLTKKVNYWVYY